MPFGAGGGSRGGDRDRGRDRHRDGDRHRERRRLGAGLLGVGGGDRHRLLGGGQLARGLLGGGAARRVGVAQRHLPGALGLGGGDRHRLLGGGQLARGLLGGGAARRVGVAQRRLPGALGLGGGHRHRLLGGGQLARGLLGGGAARRVGVTKGRLPSAFGLGERGATRLLGGDRLALGGGETRLRLGERLGPALLGGLGLPVGGGPTTLRRGRLAVHRPLARLGGRQLLLLLDAAPPGLGQRLLLGGPRRGQLGASLLLAGARLARRAGFPLGAGRVDAGAVALGLDLTRPRLAGDQLVVAPRELGVRLLARPVEALGLDARPLDLVRRRPRALRQCGGRAGRLLGALAPGLGLHPRPLRLAARLLQRRQRPLRLGALLLRQHARFLGPPRRRLLAAARLARRLGPLLLGGADRRQRLLPLLLDLARLARPLRFLLRRVARRLGAGAILLGAGAQAIRLDRLLLGCRAPRLRLPRRPLGRHPSRLGLVGLAPRPRRILAARRLRRARPLLGLACQALGLQALALRLGRRPFRLAPGALGLPQRRRIDGLGPWLAGDDGDDDVVADRLHPVARRPREADQDAHRLRFLPAQRLRPDLGHRPAAHHHRRGVRGELRVGHIDHHALRTFELVDGERRRGRATDGDRGGRAFVADGELVHRVGRCGARRHGCQQGAGAQQHTRAFRRQERTGDHSFLLLETRVPTRRFARQSPRLGHSNPRSRPTGSLLHDVKPFPILFANSSLIESRCHPDADTVCPRAPGAPARRAARCRGSRYARTPA
jgi:hypothetical protein